MCVGESCCSDYLFHCLGEYSIIIIIIIMGVKLI